MKIKWPIIDWTVSMPDPSRFPMVSVLEFFEYVNRSLRNTFGSKVITKDIP